MQTKEIVSPSFVICVMECLQAGAEGWGVDVINFPIVLMNGIYQVNLVKEDNDKVTALKKEIFEGGETEQKKLGRPFGSGKKVNK